MTKFALTCAALIAAATITFAGTPEQFKSPQQIEMPPTCAQFVGFNAGLTIGGAFHTWEWNDRDAWVDDFGTDWALGGVEKDRSGVTVGGTLGYDWQKNCALFGLVVDGNWTSIDGTTRYSPTGDSDGTELFLHENVNFFGTARARTGIVMDNLLLYVTGGFAFADMDHRYHIHDEGQTPNENESFSADSFRWGGCVGFGTEWAFNRHWSFRSEFLYAYFEEESHSGFSENADQHVHFDNQDTMAIARASIVYRFGGGH